MMSTYSAARPCIAAAVLFLLLCVPVFAQALTVERGPYLQTATPHQITVKWRTDTATDSVVRYGSAPNTLVLSETITGNRTNHAVEIQGLQPDTRYYDYSIGNSAQTLASGDTSHSFVTSPPTGLSSIAIGRQLNTTKGEQQ